MPHSLQFILTQDKAALESALSLDSTTARIEVQMLLQHVLGISRAYLLAHPEQILNEAQATAYDALLQRRLAGEPLAHILGEREFFGMNFKVTPATLIPRADTELLVELALQRVPQKPPSPQPSPAKEPSPQSSPACGRGGKRERQFSILGRVGLFRLLDLGTGSGAIALSIAHARPDVEVTAVDALRRKGATTSVNGLSTRLLQSAHLMRGLLHTPARHSLTHAGE